MRLPVLAAAALLAVPSLAHAASVRSQTRDVRPAARVLTQPFAGGFDLVGVNSQGPGTVSFRVHKAGRWTAWHGARPEAEDVPDAAGRWKTGNPWWTGRATVVQLRIRGRVTRLRTTVVRSPEQDVPLRTFSAVGSPGIIPRIAWAGPSPTAYRRKVAPGYADAVRFAVVHHTAGASPATPEQSAAMVRAIAVYHVQANGWNDIGYNFLVDRFGQIFEGRYGGIDRPVIGAHAEGFNTGSVGVALIGTYSGAPPSAAAQSALVRLLAWRLDLAHVDPLAKVTYASGGNPEYRAGKAVSLRVISGHRDTGFTSCPGDKAYALLPSIAARVASTGLPKLYYPTVQGAPGGPVRFTGRLSGAVPWQVTISDADGTVVAGGTGTGPVVDWTWDSRQVPAGTYHWTMSAGTARPARGSLTGGTTSAALALTATASPTVVSPDGDGHADAGTVSYRLGRSALVSATLLDPLGTVLANLTQGEQTAGAHTLNWPADAYPDGPYTILLAAQAAGQQVTATVPVSVNRTLAGLAVSAPAFSPALGALSYSFALTAAANVTVSVARTGAVPVVLSTASLPAGSQTVQWAGTDASGVALPDGAYTLAVQAVNPVGTVTQTAPVTIDAKAPQLQLVSRRPVKLRASEAVTLTISADGRTIMARAKAGVRRISVGGKRVVVFGTDAAGNRSPTLRLR
jgi:flagellar hook assembly protein FlgD